MKSITSLLNQTLTGIYIEKHDGINREITFITSDRRQYVMFYPVDAVELVQITSTSGDLENIINSPIIHIEETSSVNDIDENNCSKYIRARKSYKLVTEKGEFIIYWAGITLKKCHVYNTDRTLTLDNIEFAEEQSNDDYRCAIAYDHPKRFYARLRYYAR